MPKSLKEFTSRQRSKWERKQLAKQKQLKRGRYSKQKATKMSKDAGFPMYYMDNNDHLKPRKV